LAQDVVRDVSLKIPDGCRFAIVGVSGSGKSTLISMIAGIERPRVGRVRVGGFDLRSAATSDLTNHVVMLAQEDHVFYGSVRDNLTLSDPSASDEALWEALDMAGAREWAEALDDGLDTALGDDAAPVEVDRARQLALARLFLKRPKVLLLDEATAPLSRLEEDSLLQALEERLPGVTVIQVAHSLRAAERADTVAVMSAGAVVELGSHEELSRGDGAYAQAWKAWRDAEAEGDFPRSSNGGGLAL
jgi:ATP-binding cassette subfamily C protein